MGEQDRRSSPRLQVTATAELYWKLQSGEKHVENGRVIDLSEGGMALWSPEPVPADSSLILRSDSLDVVALATVCQCAWSGAMYRLSTRFSAKTTTTLSSGAPDYYELLRVGSAAEPDAIERVFRTLVKRYHPDNQETGDSEKLLLICEAWRILSNPGKRRAYDEERLVHRQTNPPLLNAHAFFNGFGGEKNRRLAILLLLYRKRATDYQFPGMSVLDLETITGLTREEVGFALWYLADIKAVFPADNASYAITAVGVDILENAQNAASPEFKQLLPGFL